MNLMQMLQGDAISPRHLTKYMKGPNKFAEEHLHRVTEITLPSEDWFASQAIGLLMGTSRAAFDESFKVLSYDNYRTKDAQAARDEAKAVGMYPILKDKAGGFETIALGAMENPIFDHKKMSWGVQGVRDVCGFEGTATVHAQQDSEAGPVTFTVRLVSDIMDADVSIRRGLWHIEAAYAHYVLHGTEGSAVLLLVSPGAAVQTRAMVLGVGPYAPFIESVLANMKERIKTNTFPAHMPAELFPLDRTDSIERKYKY